MKTYKIALTEEEVKAVIMYHSEHMSQGHIDAERSRRIHDLTKRLKDDGPEIEKVDIETSTEQKAGW
jgi:hypothetical protein